MDAIMATASDDEPHASTAQSLDDNEIPIVQHIVNPAAVQPRNTFRLEGPILLLFFAWNLSGTVFQNQILFQSCMTTLRFNESECDAVINDASANEEIEKQLEEYASKLFMCRAILENIIPAFISFLIGPWSDKFGRKPVLLSTSLGYFLVYFILTIVSILSLKTEISPWYYLLAFVPLSVLGGMCGLITGIFCYITDVSSQNDRAFRIARMEAVVFVGLLVGSMSSGRLYLATSASFVFGLATLSSLVALLCLYMFLDESVKNVTGITSSWAKFKAFFNMRHVGDLFHTCFKRRENHDRILIWMVIFTLATTMFVLEGSVTLSYLFMRQKFKWQINDYNTYAATNVICQVIGNIFGTYVLNQMLRVPETIIGIIGYFSAMVEYIICGLANQSWQLYLASMIVLLKGVAVPMCRSFLATLVPSNEIGKIYSMTTSMESLAPITSAPIYTFIYNFTIDSYPGAFNFFSATMYLMCILIISAVYIVHRRSNRAVAFERLVD